MLLAARDIASARSLAKLLLLVIAVQLLVKECSATAAAAEDQKIEALLAWLGKHPGFESKVRFGRNAKGVRGLFAATDIAQGEAVLSIPPTAIMNMGGGQVEDGYTEPAARMLKQLRNRNTSRFGPYLEALPGPAGVLNLCNMPEEYTGLMPGYWKDAYGLVQGDLRAFLSGDHDRRRGRHVLSIWLEEVLGVEAANVTLDELRYACALSSTRTLDAFPRNVVLLIPLFDMVNHYSGCTTHVGATNSKDNRHRLIAGSAIKAGQEVCYSYIHEDFHDHLMFGYGFLPDLPHGATPSLMWMDAQGRNTASAANGEPWESDPSRLQAEVTRLTALLAGAEKDIAEQHNTPPIPGHEHTHAQLVGLQVRRRAALLGELSRLGQAKLGGSSSADNLDGGSNNNSPISIDGSNSSSSSGGGSSYDSTTHRSTCAGDQCGSSTLSQSP